MYLSESALIPNLCFYPLHPTHPTQEKKTQNLSLHPSNQTHLADYCYAF